MGVTEQLVNEKCDLVTYHAEVLLLRDIRLKYNKDLPAQEVQDDYISIENEAPIVLLRHWNIYSSMLHSIGIANHLGVWKENGRRRLDTLIAKMGSHNVLIIHRIPLSQCKADFSSMDMEFKHTFSIQFSKLSVEFGVIEPSIETFCRQFGFAGKLSARDCVLSLSAILNIPDPSQPFNNFYIAMDAINQ